MRACPSGHECVSKFVSAWQVIVIDLELATIKVSFFVSHFFFTLSQNHVHVVLDRTRVEIELEVLLFLEWHAFILAVV